MGNENEGFWASGFLHHSLTQSELQCWLTAPIFSGAPLTPQRSTTTSTKKCNVECWQRTLDTGGDGWWQWREAKYAIIALYFCSSSIFLIFLSLITYSPLMPAASSLLLTPQSSCLHQQLWSFLVVLSFFRCTLNHYYTLMLLLLVCQYNTSPQHSSYSFFAWLTT